MRFVSVRSHGTLELPDSNTRPDGSTGQVPREFWRLTEAPGPWHLPGRGHREADHLRVPAGHPQIDSIPDGLPVEAAENDVDYGFVACPQCAC